MSTPTVSIIVPVFNPPTGWVQNMNERLNELFQFISPQQCQLVVVNDGSTKGFDAPAQAQLQSIFPNAIIESYTPNKGKGYAVRHGLSKTNSNCYLLTDVDLPYTTETMLAVLEKLQATQLQAVIPVRNNSYYEQTKWGRRVVSQLLRKFIRLFFHIAVDDTQAGLKGIDQSGKKIMLQTKQNRYLYDLEFLILMAKQKQLSVGTVTAQLRAGLALNSLNMAIILRELFNLIKLLKLRYF
jgi:glycosyltransferase involved in cell wall biosynthesis